MYKAEKSVIRAGFSWQTLTSDNLGVAALAEAQLSIARTAAQRAGVELSCIEFCPPGPNVKLAKLRNCEIADQLSIKKIILGQSAYLKQLKACDVMLDIGAGDSFSDIYGQKHFFFLSLSKALALIHRIPLVLSPQTIGPFDSKFSKVVSAWLIGKASKTFARDGLSMNYLRYRDLTKNSVEVIDVAFRLPFDRQRQADDGLVHVGVNVSGLLFNGGYTKKNQFGLTVDYEVLIRRLLEALASRTDVKVHLVGHVISETFEVEDDYRVIERLQKEFSGSVVAPRFTSPSEAKSYISSLHFFTGARMHACIGAFSSGVAVVPMAYSRKFNGLFNSLGYTHIADLKAHDTDQALAEVLKGLDDRVRLAKEVAAGNELAQTKIQVYEDYLFNLFGTLKHGRH